MCERVYLCVSLCVCVCGNFGENWLSDQKEVTFLYECTRTYLPYSLEVEKQRSFGAKYDDHLCMN